MPGQAGTGSHDPHNGPRASRGPAPTRPGAPHVGRRRRAFADNTRYGRYLIRSQVDAPTAARFAAPDVADIDGRICRERPGYVRVSRRARARQLWDDLVEVEGIGNANGRRTRRAVWDALVAAMHPASGRIVAGQSRLSELASDAAGYRVAPSTVGNHVRALEAAGVVYVAQRGASKTVTGGGRDRCPTYVIVMPEHLATPTPDPDPEPAEVVAPMTEHLGGALLDALAPETTWLTGDQFDTHTHLSAVLAALPPIPPAPVLDLVPAGPATAPAGGVDKVGYLPEGSALAPAIDITPPRPDQENTRSKALNEPATPALTPGPERYAPRTDREHSAAVAQLIVIMGWRFTRRTDEELRKIIGPYLRAGWCLLAILHGLRRQPNGQPWPGPMPNPYRRGHDQARNPWAVLAARLAAWCDHDGRPGTPPVQAAQPPTTPAPAAPAAPSPGPTRPATPPPAAYQAARAALALRRSTSAAATRIVRPADPVDTHRQAPDVESTPTPARTTAPHDLARARALFRARTERRNRP